MLTRRPRAMRRVAQMQADMHDVMGAGRTLMHLSELYHDRYADPNGQHDALHQALLECLRPSILCICEPAGRQTHSRVSVCRRCASSKG